MGDAAVGMTLYIIAGLVLAGLWIAYRLRRTARIEAERDALSRAVEAEREREEIHGEVVALSDDALRAELARFMRRPGDIVLRVEGDIPKSGGLADTRDG